LDPTTRRVQLPDRRELLLSDTVGFIQKLPTTLVAAFRATLEEVIEADLLLHVVDASHPNAAQHIEAVEDTLAEIDAGSMPRILVLNKTDRLDRRPPSFSLVDTYVGAAAISAQEKQGLDELLDLMGAALEAQMTSLEVVIPYQTGKVYSDLYDKGYIQSEQTNSDGWRLQLRLPTTQCESYRRFAISETS